MPLATSCPDIEMGFSCSGRATEMTKEATQKSAAVMLSKSFILDWQWRQNEGVL